MAESGMIVGEYNPVQSDIRHPKPNQPTEYLIQKYGNGKFLPAGPGSLSSSPPSKAALDDLYFTHYTEGTLMPLLVNKLIFSLVPSRVPFLLRPIAKVLFGGVSKNLLDPRIANNLKFVRFHLQLFSKMVLKEQKSHDRSTITSLLHPIHLPRGSLTDQNLLRRIS